MFPQLGAVGLLAVSCLLLYLYRTTATQRWRRVWLRVRELFSTITTSSRGGSAHAWLAQPNRAQQPSLPSTPSSIDAAKRRLRSTAATIAADAYMSATTPSRAHGVCTPVPSSAGKGTSFRLGSAPIYQRSAIYSPSTASTAPLPRANARTPRTTSATPRQRRSSQQQHTPANQSTLFSQAPSSSRARELQALRRRSASASAQHTPYSARLNTPGRNQSQQQQQQLGTPLSVQPLRRPDTPMPLSHLTPRATSAVTARRALITRRQGLRVLLQQTPDRKAGTGSSTVGSVSSSSSAVDAGASRLHIAPSSPASSGDMDVSTPTSANPMGKTKRLIIQEEDEHTDEVADDRHKRSRRAASVPTDDLSPEDEDQVRRLG
jgi:hypothetical protein